MNLRFYYYSKKNKTVCKQYSQFTKTFGWWYKGTNLLLKSPPTFITLSSVGSKSGSIDMANLNPISRELHFSII